VGREQDASARAFRRKVLCRFGRVSFAVLNPINALRGKVGGLGRRKSAGQFAGVRCEVWRAWRAPMETLMAHDEPLPDTEEEAREIANNDNRWELQREPVSWDPIKLLVVSGHSMNKVAERLGVCPSMVKRRKKKDPTFQPMGTVQQRHWLAVVLKRALTLRWARVDPDAGDAVEAALEKLCAWRPTMTTPYAFLRSVTVSSALPVAIGARQTGSMRWCGRWTN